LVAPISRTSIVGGKILGTTILSVGQAALVLAFAPFAGISLGPLEVVGTLLLMVVIAVGLAGLGISIAWRMDSTQGFHAIMMSFLMPMWFLSGAFFPSAGLPLWLKTLVTINPLTYGLAAVRRVLYWSKPGLVGDVPALAPSIFATIAFAVAMIALSTRIASAQENPVRGT
jgi:ABC-type polysaccharide/polyol phosphate export permease